MKPLRHKSLKTFIINLARDKEKRECLESSLQKFNCLQYDFFNAIDARKLSPKEIAALTTHKINQNLGTKKEILSAGEICCSASHLAIYDTIVAQSIPQALILEDDVTFFPQFEATIQSIIDKKILETDKPVIILLSSPYRFYRKSNITLNPHTKLHKIHHALLAHAYLINQSAASCLHTALQPIFTVADNWFYIQHKTPANVLTCIPHVTHQNHDLVSNIAHERDSRAALKKNMISSTKKVSIRLIRHLHRAIMFPFLKRYRGPRGFEE